jgi:hypothetical protein
MSFYKTSGEGTIIMAVRERRSGEDFGGANVLSFIWNRLAVATESLASYGGGMTAAD